MEDLYKEIDLIQSCINRMSQFSFLIKGWTVSLIAVVLTLFSASLNMNALSAICYVIIVVFWGLDAYYLHLERLFRFKYEWVIQHRKNTKKYMFDLNPHNKKMRINHSNSSLLKVFFSLHLCVLYGTLILLVTLALINSRYKII